MTSDAYQQAAEAAESRADHLIQRIADKVGVTVKASTIFGDAAERDGLTVIPVAKARWGFGGGGGTGQEGGGSGGGGGGGMTISPVGYIELRGGQSTFCLIRDPLSYVPLALAGGIMVMLILRELRQAETWLPEK